MRTKTYKIIVLTLQNKTLTFHVNTYSITDNNTYIQFTDQKTRRTLKFPINKTEIQVLK